MNSTASSFPKLENHDAYHQSLFLEVQEQLPPSPAAGVFAWEQQMMFADTSFHECAGLGTLCNSDDLLQILPWQNNYVSCLEFKDFEDICHDDFGLWAQDINQSFLEEHKVVDSKPLISDAGDTKFDHRSGSAEKVGGSSTTVIGGNVSPEEGFQNGRYINVSSGLQFDDIRKYFDVPITKAAKELKVGLTVLKKRCRELNIMRWPHRKIKSLKFLIQNAKELGLTDEVEMLEEHKRMLHRRPQMELTERTKKLRQACFKANYKKRRALAAAQG